MYASSVSRLCTLIAGRSRKSHCSAWTFALPAARPSRSAVRSLSDWLAVEEKPHVAHQHCQTDTTQKATCGGGGVGKKSRAALAQDELTRHNIWSTSFTQQRIVCLSKWKRILEWILQQPDNILRIESKFAVFISTQLQISPQRKNRGSDNRLKRICDPSGWITVTTLPSQMTVV